MGLRIAFSRIRGVLKLLPLALLRRRAGLSYNFALVAGLFFTCVISIGLKIPEGSWHPLVLYLQFHVDCALTLWRYTFALCTVLPKAQKPRKGNVVALLLRAPCLHYSQPQSSRLWLMKHQANLAVMKSRGRISTVVHSESVPRFGCDFLVLSYFRCNSAGAI